MAGSMTAGGGFFIEEVWKMATKKLTVEIELPENMAESFNEFVEDRCLDQEKYLKKLLADSIIAVLKKRERALAYLERANAARGA
jgi:hypothetical protein